MKKILSGLTEQIKADLANFKREMPGALAAAANKTTPKGNNKPSSVTPPAVIMNSNGSVSVVQEANPGALPGRLPELAQMVGQVYYSTDNIYREMYSAAKKLGIDSGTARMHMRAILETAQFIADERIKATRTADTTADQFSKSLSEILGQKVWK